METKEKINWDGEFGALERVTFMSDLLSKQVEIRNMLDLRTNIMIGFNSALIVFFASSFKASWADSVFFISAMITVLFSMFFALMALKPSRFSTKHGQIESMFYHHKICSLSEEDYRHEIRGILSDEDKIYDTYIREIYNLTKYSNVPRKHFLNISIRFLLYGMFFSLLLLGLSMLPDLFMNFGFILF